METMDVSIRVNSVQSFLKPRSKGVTLYDVWKKTFVSLLYLLKQKHKSKSLK